MNPTTRLALLAVITAALGGLTYAQYTGLQSAVSARNTARETRDETQQRAAQLPAERQRQDTLLLSNAELQNTLPEREKLASLLRELRLGAMERGVQVGNVTRKADASPLPGVTAINLDLSVQGPYPAVQSWLEELWRTDRALTIPTGTISASDGGVEGTLKVIAYARNVPTPPAAPAPSPGSPTPTGGPTP